MRNFFFFIIIFFLILIPIPSSFAEVTEKEDVTVNSLLKEGFKITKEELVKVHDSTRLMKILTLKKGKLEYALCSIAIGVTRGPYSANCVKP